MKKLLAALLTISLVGTAYACRQWTTTTTQGGRTVTCFCTDCGQGPNCNCF